MFLEHFKAAFPKLIAMRDKEALENLEKRLKEVKKLIIKRKKKLEIDDTPADEMKPTSKQSDARQRQVKFDEEELNEREEQDQPASRNDELPKKNSSKAISEKKPPAKSRGGDPHGAIQRMEDEAMEKLRKEKEVQENINVSQN